MADLSTPTHDGQPAESLITMTAKDGGNVASSEYFGAGAIIDHIDIWTTAIEQKSSAGRGSSKKFSLYGIKKLRELILELAVRGKLVPQDVNDEPAALLLERIAAEKAQLVKEGKLKKQKPLPEISDDEKPFELPNGWVLARLGNLVLLENGDRSKNYPNKSVLVDSGIPFVNAGHLINGLIAKEEMTFITDERFELLRAGKFVDGDILFCLRGSLGKSALVDGFDTGAIASSLVIVRTGEALLSRYLLMYFNSPLSFSNIKKYDNGTAQPNLSAADLGKFIVPSPPLEEQHRIVAKVDELMSLCDALEAQTEASISAHQTLVETLLNALLQPNTTQAADSQSASPVPSFADSLKPALNDSFIDSWQRVAEHFDTLFTTEASIDTLKQTILQLAVMGKLVPQDANDEPAAKLLERINAEKAQLIKDGKIKKQKPLVSFEGLDDLKKQLPNSWKWIRLADTADLVRGGSPRPAGDPRFYGGNIPFLKVGDITRKSSKFVEGFNSTITEAGLHKTRLIETRTVLLTNSGATLGIPAICTFPATFNDGVAAFVEKSQFIFDEYLHLYLSTISKWFLDIASRGQGQPNLNTDIIKATWFALPPLEEQHRIVAKVDELMALCDQLKARLTDAQTTQLHLTDAIVEQAI